MIYGILDSVYDYLIGLNLDLSSYFSSTPQVDDGGNIFYAYIGDADDWLIFLVENGLDPDDYELGLFTLINSQQGSGTTP